MNCGFHSSSRSPASHPFLRGFIGAPLVILALTAGSSPLQAAQQADLAPICRNVVNGDFEEGYQNWTLEPAQSGFGSHSNHTSSQLSDLSHLGWSGSSMCMDVVADAGWNAHFPTGSSAQTQMTLVRSMRVTNRYLAFQAFGLFEFFISQQGTVRYCAKVLVTGENGQSLEYSMLDYLYQGQQSCDVGLQALGVVVPGPRSLDLLGQGFVQGELVTVRVIWSTTTSAAESCDNARFEGFLCVDDFSFCQRPYRANELPSSPLLSFDAPQWSPAAALELPVIDRWRGAVARLSRGPR